MTTEDPRATREEQINAALQERDAALQERERYASRRQSNWGDGFPGERLPGYQIQVIEQTKHGSAAHRFVLDPDTWDEPGGPHWRRYTEKAPPRGPFSELGERWWGVPRRPLAPVEHLANGVDVSAAMLTAIFEALVSKGRHRIELADLKRVVSQLGSRIAQLDALPDESRLLAEPALYAAILDRLP